MRKRDEINDPNSCLNRAADDEPVFVLRAKDRLAPAAIYEWARVAARDQVHEPERIQEARMLAEAMINWRASQGLDD